MSVINSPPDFVESGTWPSGSDTTTIESSQVAFWKQRIQSAINTKVYQNFRDNKREAKEFYKGVIFTDKERSNWEGDEAKINLFRKNLNFKMDAVYAEDPQIKVTIKKKLSSNPMAQKWADAVYTHLDYLWEEEDQGRVVRSTFKDAHFSNFSVVKIDFDEERGLFRGKLVFGDFIFDPDARGDISRARWVAESIKLPRYRVWQDETFDPKAREAIRSRSNTMDSTDYKEDIGEGKDQETIWYIYSHEGIQPTKGVEPIKGRLLIYCENYSEGWLLNVENPTPWLDHDQFPYVICQPDEFPGEMIGPAPWKLEKATVRAFNWAWSYNLAKMRKSATFPIGFDKNKIDDPDVVFKSRRMMQPIAVDGPVGPEVIQPLDVGSNDNSMLQNCQALYELNDQVTGITDIARGEKFKTQTATESQIRQQNSNIVLRGPTRALDDLIHELVTKLALVTLYYMPAFSIVEDPNSPTGFSTKQVVQMPQMGMDQMTGQPMMQMVPTIQVVPIEALKTTRGADYFHGDDVAMNWPQIPFEEISNELDFDIEAGSSNADHRLEKQRTAETLMQTLGAEFKASGLDEEFYHLLEFYIDSFELPDRAKFLPPLEIYMQKVMAMRQMQTMQSMQQPENGPSKAAPEKLEKSKNEGKRFPLGSDVKGTGNE